MYTRRFWVDTETTGLNPKKHFAFQISYLIEADNKILLERTLEMCPDNYEGFEFTKEAEKIHGYSRAKIRSLPPETEPYSVLLEDLRQFAENRLTITGYNIPFDIYFLKAFFARHKPAGTRKGLFYQYFDYMYCDVMQLVQAHRIAGKLNLPSIELEKVCTHLGISVEGAHNSMIDILNTKAVFDRLIDR
ncbi:MAG: 3'-5' exonuclease [Treponema sp.]|jgi:DNA polymerase III epsilon subunit-like protein|nr:3'-5' exonuclease [Treponema sp.]